MTDRSPERPTGRDLPALSPEAPSTPEARGQAEWEKDLLVALAGRAEQRRPDAPGAVDPRFAAWLAAEQHAGRGATPDDTALAGRLHARVEAARLGVRRIARRPAIRPAPEATSVARALDRAPEQGCAPWLDLAIAAGAGRELWDEACESWVALPDDLPRGRFVALTVAGDSMTPLLHSGDVVLVKLGADLARDRVVVARRPDDGYVVKRVGELDAASVELLSLNPSFPPVRIDRRDDLIVGTVVVRWCAHPEGAQMVE
jgi:SOS-response transcriptional repressor LexA